MNISRYFRISEPSAEKVPQEQVAACYKRLRNRTIWGITAAYSLFYLCRMTFSVVKQPMIDSGVLDASQLGIIGSAMFFIYAVGKFCNGFIADYCNIRRYMAVGLMVSSLLNLIIGLLGIFRDDFALAPSFVFIIFAVLWALNGWTQSMGSPPTVISLSRWFPLASRGTYYSIICATPYLGKAMSYLAIGAVVGICGWYWGFLLASAIGFAGAAVILIFVSDTPESCGLPSVQELSGEAVLEEDKLPVKVLQNKVIRHPAIWIIALSSAFVYITQYAISGWGVLFLQKAKDFSLARSTSVMAIQELFGILGTVGAGWISDRLFRGNRLKPVAISGVICSLSLWLFLFTDSGTVADIIFLSVFSMTIGTLYCLVAGLMAIDIVPRKATGAALGIVGIFSYVAAGVQDVVSGYMIHEGSRNGCGFTSAAIFWLVCSILAFLLPVIFGKMLKAPDRR